MNEIEELKAALHEAMQWNWLEEDNLPPREVVERCYRALGEPIPPELLK